MPINYHLVGPEIAYIINDSEAKAFITHERFAEEALRAGEEVTLDPKCRFAIGEVEGFRPYAELKDGQPTTLPEDRTAGGLMNYTSGTTGKPKGVKRPLPPIDPDDVGRAGHLPAHAVRHRELRRQRAHHGRAALSHGRRPVHPERPARRAQVVLMDKWTPEGTLERIERYRVTTSHMVPTMFHRMLQLPEDERAKYDVSSLRHVIHSRGAVPDPHQAPDARLVGPGPSGSTTRRPRAAARPRAPRTG